MSLEIPRNYSVNELVDLAKSGWEGVLGTYWGPVTWIIGLISWFVLLGLAFGIGTRLKNAWITFGLVFAGTPMLGLTWWQMYYAVLAGLLWIYIIIAVVAVLAAWQVSPYSLIAVGLGTSVLTFLWWIYPESFLWLALI